MIDFNLNWSVLVQCSLWKKIGFKNIVDLLIQNGANVNLMNRDDDSPFILALKNGHEEISERIIGSGGFKLEKWEQDVIGCIGNHPN